VTTSVLRESLLISMTRHSDDVQVMICLRIGEL